MYVLLSAISMEFACTPIIWLAINLLLCSFKSMRLVHFAALDPFYVEVEYLGTWTDARIAVFERAAVR